VGLKYRFGYDDSLDVVGVHLVGGLIGTLLHIPRHPGTAMRFDTGSIGQAFTEVCAYGTAVIVEPIAQGEAGATRQSAGVVAGQPQQR